MEDASRIVGQLYEGHPYPAPSHDLTRSIANGRYQVGDPSLWAPMLWPEGRPAKPLNILVAGCGTEQAAWFAFTNRDASVIGIDLSEASLAHQRFLQDKHGLRNLRLLKGDLREVGKLDEAFDLVVCTGVLHHMHDPDEGLKALAGVMAPYAVLSAMVYAAGVRVGVYMLQDLFRTLEVEPNAEGVAFVRETLRTLPAWHYARWYLQSAPELKDDAAIVDTFLHPQDRAYRVKEVLEFVERGGLHFQGWFENSQYYPEGYSGLSARMTARLADLPPTAQWAAMEQLFVPAQPHFFFARKAAPPAIAFDKQSAALLVPHLNPGLRRSGPQWSRRGIRVSMTGEEAALLERVDGTRTIAAIAADQEPFAIALFERLWKQGHVMVTKPGN